MTKPEPALWLEFAPEPLWGSVRVIVHAVGVEAVRIRRLADGLTAVVRGADNLNTKTGGTTISDTEYPFGQDVTYWAESITPAGVVSNMAVFHDDGDPCRMIISDPTLPLLSRWFQVSERATLTTEARQDMANIIGARTPTAVTDVRSGYADTTVIVVRDPADLRALRMLLRSGRPLVLRYPGEWNEPLVYVAVGGVVETRLATPRAGVNTGPNPDRSVALEWIEVSAPRGAIVQRIGVTYRELRDGIPESEPTPITYAQVRLHNSSYLDLLVTGVDW